jgi:hypothetical protein
MVYVRLAVTSFSFLTCVLLRGKARRVEYLLHAVHISSFANKKKKVNAFTLTLRIDFVIVIL